MTGNTAPFMVIDTDIWSSGIWSKRIFMSSTESIATPALPTSPDPLVIRIVAAMRRQVECYRESLLPGGQIAAVERVRFFGRRKSRVLADGPRLPRTWWNRTAQKRRHARGVLQVLRVEIVGRVPGLHRDVLGRHPDV